MLLDSGYDAADRGAAVWVASVPIVQAHVYVVLVRCLRSTYYLNAKRFLKDFKICMSTVDHFSFKCVTINKYLASLIKRECGKYLCRTKEGDAILPLYVLVSCLPSTLTS
jgi:hypothetical protein